MRILAFLALFAAAPAMAHEFWISPPDYTVAPGDPLVADIRVGQEFSGSAYSFVEQNFNRFEVIGPSGPVDVTGRAGDRPALNMSAPEEGLMIVVHETTTYTLTYSEWQKFVNFATHKDFTHVLDEHREKGLPDTGFVEAYIRYAKSLVAVGDGAGSDKVVGLRTEIVAGKNPYTDDLSDGFPVQVLLDGAPRAGAQVELFERGPDGTVTISLHRTDAEGNALLPLRPDSEYLVDAVAMEYLDPPGKAGAVWRSLWASLTFHTPAADGS